MYTLQRNKLIIGSQSYKLEYRPFGCAQTEILLQKIEGDSNPSYVEYLLEKDGVYYITDSSITHSFVWFYTKAKDTSYYLSRYICNCCNKDLKFEDVLCSISEVSGNLGIPVLSLYEVLKDASFIETGLLACRYCQSVGTRCNHEASIKTSLVHYLSLYVHMASENADVDFIKKLFNVEDLACCLEKYGIDYKTFFAEYGSTFNSAPIVNDLEINVPCCGEQILTYDMFKSVFEDPEGDDINSIYINVSVPLGHFEYDGNYIGDDIFISVTKQDLLDGKLKYVAEDNPDGYTVETIFGISDEGSGKIAF